ncbi:MAG: hypothetical protein AAF671_13935 [Pseudomonadota bacterium]
MSSSYDGLNTPDQTGASLTLRGLGEIVTLLHTSRLLRQRVDLGEL